MSPRKDRLPGCVLHLILGLGTCLLPIRAAAEEPRSAASLSFERGPGTEACPNEARLRELVSRHLGYDPFRATAALHLRVTLRSSSDRLEARIDAHRDGEGAGHTRTLSAPHGECEELAAAVSLCLAMVIDPLVLLRPPTQTEARPLPPSPATDAASEPELAPTAAALRAELQVGGRASKALLPGVGYGGSVGVRLRRSHLSAAVEGLGEAATTLELPRGAIETSLLAGTLELCAQREALAVCGVTTAGSMRVIGRGFHENRRGAVAVWVVGLRPTFDVAITPQLGARVWSDVSVAITRTRLLFGDELLWTSSRVSVAIGAAITWRVL